MEAARGEWAKVRLPSGVIVILPLAWTDKVVRQPPLEHRGTPVFLRAEALRELSMWVEVRSDREVARRSQLSEKQPHADGGGGSSVAALVGQARAPRLARRGQGRRGARGEKR